MAAHDVRKPICMALAILLCAGVWSLSAADETLRGYTANDGYQYVELGVYPQTLEGGREPIVWRVLYADAQTALLLSEYVLFHHRIHYDDTAYAQSSGAFETTELYAYLNGEFLECFSDDEQALMTADETGGRITLLTRDDLKNKAYGFTGDTARRGYPTAYAVQNGLFQYTNGSSPYWTRTQSTSRDYGAVCTKEDGNLGYIRVVVQNEGCRPAVYLDVHRLMIQSGSGTKADPFVLTLQNDRSIV